MRHITSPLDLLAGATIYLDKPLGWSSFALVNKFRYLASKHLGVRRVKVGHAGTLDPLATGVMILCTGKHTKRIESLQQGIKEYVADIYLGATTPTFDLESEIDKVYSVEHISKDLIAEVLPQFVGEIDQVPPVFSACKIEGRRAYDMARRGESVELAPKRIIIHELEVLAYDAPHHLKVRIRCGKGTYIRSLARDLGVALGAGAYLVGLQRTQVGDARLENCITLDELPAWLEAYVSPISAVQ